MQRYILLSKYAVDFFSNYVIRWLISKLLTADM